MSKQESLKLSKEDAEIIKDILEEYQKGYSKEFPPERIVSVRSIIERLS